MAVSFIGGGNWRTWKKTTNLPQVIFVLTKEII
jgi:hypothetical protein